MRLTYIRPREVSSISKSLIIKDPKMFAQSHDNVLIHSLRKIKQWQLCLNSSKSIRQLFSKGRSTLKGDHCCVSILDTCGNDLLES